MIVYDTGEEDTQNGIYLVTKIMTEEEEENEKTVPSSGSGGDGVDNVDGDVCTLLIHIGSAVLSSVALLVSKQISWSNFKLEKHPSRCSPRLYIRSTFFPYFY